MSTTLGKKIYHIIHWKRLDSVMKAGGLFCDATMSTSPTATGTIIGNEQIKGNRLTLPVNCHEGLCVGGCVPFYFCPRSVMLYVISCGNHPNLAYKGGQNPIVHLELDLNQTVQWAEQFGKKWAFTDSNAAATYVSFFKNLSDINNVPWDDVKNNSWSDPAVKEGKQSEFLVEQFCPWSLVERIGVNNRETYEEVINLLPSGSSITNPKVEIIPSWYY
ncbi:MAG: DUF4433 domain-containing protein [Akkermansia sp.]